MDLAHHTKSPTVRIEEDGDDLVMFSANDYDHFAMTQGEVFEAARNRISLSDDATSLVSLVAKFTGDLREWCKKNEIQLAIISPRMDDILIVLVASDEDLDGKTHDAMSQFDLICFSNNRLRLSWILLRNSEAAGISAFASPQVARVVFNAKAY
jgi:hypothetical protein